MNRSRRPNTAQAKPFVSGGVYDANKQQVTPSKPKPQQQQSPVAIKQEVQVQQQAELQPPPKMPQELQNATDDDAAPVQSMAVDADSVVDENGKPQFKKIFQSRKKASVRAKEKRIRQNRQLRKAILPKNALMALNEVKSLTISDFTVNNNEGGGFTAIVTVNGTQYQAKGQSKVAAKNNACEKALRDYVIARMLAKPRVQPKGQAAAANANESMDTGDANESIEGNEPTSAESDCGMDDADDVPMVNLASFALFKLFSEWESEGFVIPEMHPAAPGGGAADGYEAKEPKEPKKAPIRTELPANWETMHPASLLCLMRPGLNYNYNGTIGEKPLMLQSFGVVAGDEEFVSYGRSKKSARRNAAVVVCNKLFGTNFLKEEPSTQEALQEQQAAAEKKALEEQQANEENAVEA